jgi:DNA-binding transcriptional LysR family regulator
MTYIIAIAEEKSITKAALRLYVAQPSLSLILQKVEHQYGIRLFDRTSKGLLLTDFGKSYTDTAYHIINLHDHMLTEFCDLDNGHEGILKIGINSRLGSFLLPILLPKFSEQYPNVKFELTEGAINVIEEKLTGFTVDIAICNMPSSNKKLGILNLQRTVHGLHVFLQ